ncbi:MAG: helix-turn-helix domain-containing protein [Verrucomicrobia bacterium]|jgi:hypothetical protein|nr:helix-turn-helix domain-containing protein [Verrucomicrobiota bacterium]
MSKPDPNTLLTKEEAKARLGIKNDKELYSLIRRGKLRVIKYGKTNPLRFRQLDIAACLEACAVTGGEASPGEKEKEQAP